MIDKNKNTRIIFTLSKDLKEKIEKQAEKENRTVTNFIVNHFKLFFEAEETKENGDSKNESK